MKKKARRLFNEKNKTIMAKLGEALLRQVGDHRKCPHCNESFMPCDKTSDMAYAVYKELFGDKESVL